MEVPLLRYPPIKEETCDTVMTALSVKPWMSWIASLERLRLSVSSRTYFLLSSMPCPSRMVRPKP